MAQEIRFPRSTQVTQAELDIVIALENQIRSLAMIRDRQSRDILERMLAGSSVEIGTHVAEVTDEIIGPVRTLRLQVH